MRVEEVTEKSGVDKGGDEDEEGDSGGGGGGEGGGNIAKVLRGDGGKGY